MDLPDFVALAEAGIGVAEAFEACPALRAVALILKVDPKHFASKKPGSVQYAARVKPSTDDESHRYEEHSIPHEDRAAAQPESLPEKPWDVFGNTSGKSLLVYEVAGRKPPSL